MSLVVAAASTRTGCLVGDLVGDDLVGDGDLAGVGAGTGAYFAMCTAADAVAFVGDGLATLVGEDEDFVGEDEAFVGEAAFVGEDAFVGEGEGLEAFIGEEAFVGDGEAFVGGVVGGVAFFVGEYSVRPGPLYTGGAYPTDGGGIRDMVSAT